MEAKVKASAKSKEKDVPSAELIVARFQQMRAEQRAIVGKIIDILDYVVKNIYGKITEVEADRKEHRCVSVTPSLDLVLCVCMRNVWVYEGVCVCCVCACVRVCVLFFLVRLVIGTLKKTPSDRRCFRINGRRIGVLMEQAVNEVLPALENNCTKVIDNCGTINITMCQCNTCLV